MLGQQKFPCSTFMTFQHTCIAIDLRQSPRLCEVIQDIAMQERVCLYMMTEGEKKQRREKTRGPWEGDSEVSDKIAGRKF